MNKPTLITKILAATSDYTENDLKAMKVAELKDLFEDIKVEQANDEPTVDDAGNIVIPEAVVTPAEVKKVIEKEVKVKAPSKRDELFAVFDKALAEGKTNYRELAAEASPESSAGVISSYLCYWRADRNIAVVKAPTAAKATNADKVRALIVKLYGEEFVLADVIAELQGLPKLVAEETEAAE